MMKKEGFPKSIRIKKKKEWEEVIQKGEKNFGRSLLLLRLKTNKEKSRFGVSVISGIKGGVKRNRIKRILREVLRRNKEKFSPGEKIILIYRSRCPDICYNDILNEFMNLVTKTDIKNE